MRNLLESVPKASVEMVVSAIRSISTLITPGALEKRGDEVAVVLTDRLARATPLMNSDETGVLALTARPSDN